MKDDIGQAFMAGKMTPVYILYGEDAYSRKMTAQRLVDAIQQARGGADINVYNVGDCTVDDIASAIMTVPMFANTRIVLVRGFEALSGQEQARLISLVAPGRTKEDLRVADDTFVVITSSSKTVPRREITAAGANVAAMEFRQGYARDAKEFVVSRVRELGASINDDAADLLCELVGVDYGTLAGEIDKLITYLGAGRVRISLDDVRAAVGKGSSQTVFQFCDAILGGKCQAAMEILDDLARTEKPSLLIQSVLAGQIRGVMRARAELDRGRRPDEVVKILAGGNPKAEWKERKTVAQARRLTQRTLAAMLSRVARADLDIKTGVYPETIAMELLVSDLCEA